MTEFNWSRMEPGCFSFPVHHIRMGYYTDVYFTRSKHCLEHDGNRNTALMQIFQKEHAIVCGVREACALLKRCAGRYCDRQRAWKLFGEYNRLRLQTGTAPVTPGECCSLHNQLAEIENELEKLWDNRSGELEVSALEEGDRVEPWETVMTIEGVLSHYIHLETVYLGILSRATRIATNVRAVVDAANSKPVLFFPARFDRWENQQNDGYAAKIGGADAVSTDAQAEWWHGRGVGTVPHALIAAYNGDTPKTAEVFHNEYRDVNLIALVDYHNDSVQTALDVARRMGDKLWGVRLDTSGTVVDKSVIPEMGSFVPTGVNPVLVENVRNALDREGFNHVKIVVSGGFDAKKVADFESASVPVDVYGVGSSLFRGSTDYTADVVKVNGKHQSKVGREFRPNNLKRIEL